MPQEKMKITQKIQPRNFKNLRFFIVVVNI